MKTLIFIFAFVLSAFPYKYMDIIIDHDRVTETASSFLYQFDLSDSIAVIDAEIDSAKHVIVCVPGNTTTKFPRYVHYIAGKRLLLYVSAPKDAVTDDTLQVCFGTAFAAVNATATFTNNDVTNFWGIDRFSGNTFYDYAGSNDGTGTSVDTGVGQFGLGAVFNANNDIINIGSVAALSKKQQFTIEFTAITEAFLNHHTFCIVYSDAATNFYMQSNTTVLSIAMGSGASATIGLAGTFTAGQSHHYKFVYDGTLETNGNRAVLYIDGVKQTLSFTGTWPATSLDYGATTMTLGNAAASNRKVDEFGIYSTAKSAGYALDRYRMLFDTTFYSVGVMTLAGTLRLDSVGVSQFITRGTFPTIDSAYVNPAKATINGANGDSLLLTAANPLMWRSAAYPITLYSSGTAYGFNYYYRKMGIIQNYLLNLGVGF